MKIFAIVYFLGIAQGMVGPFDDKPKDFDNIKACHEYALNLKTKFDKRVLKGTILIKCEEAEDTSNPKNL